MTFQRRRVERTENEKEKKKKKKKYYERRKDLSIWILGKHRSQFASTLVHRLEPGHDRPSAGRRLSARTNAPLSIA